MAISKKEMSKCMEDLHLATNLNSFWTCVRNVFHEYIPAVDIALFLNFLHFGNLRAHYKTFKLPDNQFDYALLNAPPIYFFYANPDVNIVLTSEISNNPQAHKESDFFKNIMQPMGWRDKLTISFWQDDELIGLITVLRSEEMGDFTKEDFRKASQIYPVIRLALIRCLELEREKSVWQSIESIVQNLPYPVVILDWNLSLIGGSQNGIETCMQVAVGEDKARLFNARSEFSIPKELRLTLQELKARAFSQSQTFDKIQSINARCDFNDGSHWHSDVTLVLGNNHKQRMPHFIVEFVETTSDPCEHCTAMHLKNLTPREREVIVRVCRGSSNKEIASDLGKSLGTVKRQIQSAYGKLDINKRTQLHKLCKFAKEQAAKAKQYPTSSRGGYSIPEDV